MPPFWTARASAALTGSKVLADDPLVEGHAASREVGLKLEALAHGLLGRVLRLVLVVLVLHSLAGVHIGVGRAGHGVEEHLGHEDERAVDAREGVVVGGVVDDGVVVAPLAARHRRDVQGRLAEGV